MLKKLFEFLCLANGVSAGGDFTETKWKRQKERLKAEQSPRDAENGETHPPPRQQASEHEKPAAR